MIQEEIQPASGGQPSEQTISQVSPGTQRRHFPRRRRPHRAAGQPQAAEEQRTSQAAGQAGAPRPPDLSIVIPVYNEEQSLEELLRRIRETLAVLHMSYEIIFVDDGSTDGSFNILRRFHRMNPRIKAIQFRRNFGKSAALSVGFTHARGTYVVTMDSDLQDDPHEIPNLLKKLKEGYDLVSGWKKKRYDPISKTLPSRFFNFVTSVMTGLKLHDFNSGLKIYRNEVVKQLRIYGELHRYIPALAHWNGFRVTEIPVQHHPRRFGKSKFGPDRFLKGFLDLLTVLFTTRYIRRPLHLFGGIGVLFAIIGVAIDIYLVILKLLGETAISNRPLFLVGILFIIVGVQLISIGLIGEMITKAEHSEAEYSIREILM